MDYIKLSKEISYALRHAPWEYELEMDENGFVDIQQLLSSINEETPPAILYHGTAKRFLNSIMAEGLKPMSRQYVHLSADVETAIQVGKRRDSEPVILQINTSGALKAGIKFYHANEKVWLCKEIPYYFLSN